MDNNGGDAEEELKGGTIPEEFKRQMFYTYADYRDICLGNDIGNDVETVKTNINNFFKYGGQTDSVQQREQWWNNNAKYIWDGMLCSLSYNTNDKKMDLVVRKKLIIDHQNNNNYTSVKFPSKSGPSADAELKKFSEKPQFIRWFQEWSEEFCQKKKIKIDKIEKECQGFNVSGNRIYCSVDGYHCTRTNTDRNEVFVDLDCRSCGEECIKYKKWIGKRQQEFDKQKKKCQKEFLKYLQEKGYSSVEIFLESLNKGKQCQHNSDPKKKTDFIKYHETFGPTTYCKACPVYGVNCNRNGLCTAISKINQNKTEGTPSDIHILINDGASKGIDNELNDCYKQYSFFKGLRKQKWKCQKKNTVDQCNLTNFTNNIDIDQDIVFNELFQRWLRYFIQDYNKLKDKINPCIKRDQNGKKQTCKKSCQEYENFIEEWKKYYYSQSKKFQTDKAEDKYSDTSAADDVEEALNARDYLHDQLQKLCKNDDCKCMENASTQDEEIELSGINDFPEALDNPPKEFEEKCECSEPSEPMSCVEKTARKLRKIAEKNIDAKLKVNGNTYNGYCNNVTKETYQEPNEGTCIFKKGSLSSIGITTNQCESTGKDRLKMGDEWNCNGKTLDGQNKLCIPPRRKDMCLSKLKNISVNDISDSNTLLKKIQDAAQHEGSDIIYKLLPENPCDESIICDAMKYSFADIGDIIRGRSKIKTNNGDNLEEILKKVFREIHGKLDDDIKSKYSDNENKKYTKLREAWWDANRKEVWKAMTCNALKGAHLKKKQNNHAESSQNTSTETEQTKKCGHDSEPPDYDYIPERYRFLQEWSEYYCKALNKKQDEMKKECEQCNTQKGTECENYKDDNVCNQCKTKCEKYKEFVGKWNNEFDEQNQLYKELYSKAKTASRVNARSDPSIKFTKKLEETCNDPYSADEYLDKSTHCTDYKFSETNSNGSNYAFSPYPKEYKDKCKCYEKSTRESDKILNFIKDNIFKSPNIPGLNKIKKAIPRIPKRIKNIRPDAHTIHELVARTFPYFVPFFQKDDKTPPTHNILNDVLPSAIP
ncbi:hypothetical protein PFTANZ_05852, partial [Plasmodium falciparum Tanzania (2000708)]